ncbi:MAG: transaldolase [Anaerolineae bacterium]|nr:transaldolase [Anaerolineae bacterium]
MMRKSPVERLAETHPNLEVWWDSSPLIFERWVEDTLAAANPRRKPVLEEQLRRLYVPEDPARSVFRGSTTNPPFSLKAVQSDPAFWDRRVDDLIRTHPEAGQKELFWLTYKEVVRRGAEMYLPLFEASDCQYGWLSAQLDPRLSTEKEVMIRQAEELRATHPNVMVKVPATREGIEVLKALTAKGISTNATVCFTLPQMLAAARAVKEGMELAVESGVDLSRWRSVITMMVGRLTEREELLEQARWRGIELSWADIHWFGIAVFRRAYRIFQDRGYPSKLLACSLRAGPRAAGRERFWDVEKIAGGDIIITLAPYALEPLFAMGDGLIFRPEIEEQVPDEVLDKMSRIPYCIQAYDPNGLSPDQFNAHPSTRYMLGEFSKAAAGLEEYVGERISRARG